MNRPADEIRAPESAGLDRAPPSAEPSAVPVVMDIEKPSLPALFLPVADAAAVRVDVTYPKGATIAEIVATVMPGMPAELAPRVRVTLVTARGSEIVEAAHWRRVRPKTGVRVVIRTVPGNGNFWRSLLMIVVTIAAIALGQLWGAGLGTALHISAAAGTALITTGIPAIGMLHVDALSQG